MKILELIILIATAIVMSAFAIVVLYVVGEFLFEDIKSRIDNKKEKQK